MWFSELEAAKYDGNIFVSMAPNIHEIRGYNKLSKFATGATLAHMQVTSTAGAYSLPYTITSPLLAKPRWISANSVSGYMVSRISSGVGRRHSARSKLARPCSDPPKKPA
jgi:hypothetical protein